MTGSFKVDITSANNARRPGLWFSIKINTDEFVVLLSDEAIRKRFSDSDTTPRAAYRKNRKLIDEVARRKFLQGCPRPITIAPEDFN
jgi:hypothetical protein